MFFEKFGLASYTLRLQPKHKLHIAFEIEDFSDFDKENYSVEYYASGDKVSKINVDKGVTVIKNGYTRVKISGTEYVVDKAYIGNSVVTLNQGSTVRVFIDAYGKIADVEIMQNAGTTYAWLVSVDMCLMLVTA